MYSVRRGRGLLRSVVAVATVLALVGCTTGPDPVASFVTADGPQYFVRPVVFRGVAETDGEALLDVTVRQLRGDDNPSGAGESGETDQTGGPRPPVQVNFTVPLRAARGLAEAELRTASGARYPLGNLERFFARADTARYGSTLPREQFDRLRARPQEVELVTAAGDNGGGASGEFRYAAAEPWVRRMEILNLMLAE